MRTLLMRRAIGVPINQQDVRARRSGVRDVHADAGFQNQGVASASGRFLAIAHTSPSMRALAYAIILSDRQTALAGASARSRPA
jgi:hypothetical protein